MVTSAKLLDLRGDVLDVGLGLAGIDDGGGGGADFEPSGVAQVVLLLDEDEGDALLVGEFRDVHDDFLGLNVFGDEDEFRGAALDGLGRLVGSLLYASCISCDFQRLEGVVLEVGRNVEIYVHWHLYVHLLRAGSGSPAVRGNSRGTPRRCALSYKGWEHHQPGAGCTQFCATGPKSAFEAAIACQPAARSQPVDGGGPLSPLRIRQAHIRGRRTCGMDLARSLRTEARRANERRCLVLAGPAEQTRDRVRTALDAADVSLDETTTLGSMPFLDCEHYEQSRASELLGRTRTAVVLDCHGELRPNALGTAVGAVDGGGLLVLLTPPLEEWPEIRDAFDETLSVPPFAVGDATGHFRRRLVETLRAHRGIAVVSLSEDGETVERDGLTNPPPRRPPTEPTAPTDATFPLATYEACLTDDQCAAVRAFERLRDPDTAVVVEADRGRGKSSAAGLSAAALVLEGRDVLVTAPQYRSAAEVFARAVELFETLGVTVERDRPDAPQELHVPESGGRIRFSKPSAAVELPGDPDVVIVDEAAALPVRRLEALLAAPAVAFTTTVHGYEGAGRGFSVRFRDRLDESDHDVTDVTMTTPIRYADADPIEAWAFRALLLDARPPVEQLVTDATPETADYRRISTADLLADEHLLREVFGLLVLAHYRTEPADLARLLDAPNLTVRALTYEGHVVAVALLAREGDLPADLRATMYEGGRIRGNMVPDVLTTQLRDESAGVPVGQRVLRIATHAAVRSRGLGSKLLAAARSEFGDEVDWLGVGYGATPELVRFWRQNGYATVHLSTTRNDTSGEYSAIMLDPVSEEGKALADRHAEWFCDRIAAVLSDALDDCDPDVVRAALRAVDSTPPVALSELEWRLVAGVPGGAGILDTDPAPFRTLAVRHLVASDGAETSGGDVVALTDREERLLVRKVLQASEWDAVADELDFVSRRQCMRALGGAVERLTRRYGDAWVQEELDRHT